MAHVTLGAGPGDLSTSDSVGILNSRAPCSFCRIALQHRFQGGGCDFGSRKKKKCTAKDIADG